MNLLLALTLASSTFLAGTTVPRSMVATPCGGSNVSPQLSWSAVPAGTRSLALIVHDPDAPGAGFDHWVAYDLLPYPSHLDAGARLGQEQSGRNGTGALGYFGPCPPAGKVHHYHFLFYALDTMIHAAQPLSATELRERMRGHVLARTELLGRFER